MAENWNFMKEKLDQVDFDSYFDRPLLGYVTQHDRMQLRQSWKKSFESIKKIINIVGGCRFCGNCCIGMGISITPTEIARIAKHLNRSVNEVFEEYCRWHDDQIYLKDPCPFLKEDKKCSIYPARPTMCKFFPIKPVELNFIIVINTDCTLGQTVFRYLEKYLNSPEIKEMIEKERENTSPEEKEYLEKVSKPIEAVKLPPGVSIEPAKTMFIGFHMLEHFANWLEKNVSEF